ncbi:DegT/DnrJ/EryC1/StrS family aminotransferase [Ruthenibacterium lactatiformans]|uniref:DegT/DnrJ/EryC1/StrS family aminotransferase n=1 Tax=Ruthenibacterium lactatiformans TaxID=1550024 RepID=A0A6I3QQV1_9FIRM|nr:DegT/DnrJ/EryC1/StrS family aminotransferase [Ruthenibacterium lactatiformans]MTS16199.1 DegT/DnrJ/EryC1/StrS family aminotransferase [Ruthenibacterium lactatiformans]MTS18918.1 DegT/DnrJ/EryC1/StrS family aminotransferase [Ruthenibacterium lactatiformans]MTS35930.1 DegT/DnrJ/EryC1/StrS family aminotransferase [Ruthenibacterium lactatiformans]MTS48827.1 DegT/DnrJ/EryC1/StrS family aminotransferase [Ruthenibacterium lactatiformans]MTS51463.1 DegT/DnrJ/EryC1/StrS family aminotransferase [Ruth
MDEKIYVTRPFLPDRKAFDALVDQIWQNDYLTNNGPMVQQLSQKLCEYLNVPNINLTVNGHQALEIGLKGLGISGEVITTPFTFASTTHALTLNGIKPVFCDIKKSDLTMDETQIEFLITEKTTAILPVHVYGHPCNTQKIEEIANRYGLKVIYDAAHTFGVRVRGESLCASGDVSILSFHATKLFHTIEGGALVYSNVDYTRVFNAYKNFGIEGEERVDYIGGNAKMNEFQAAMGLCNLPCMGELIEERRQITLHYRERLTGVAGIHFFEPDRDPAVHYNFAYLPVLIEKERFGVSRDEVYDRLKREEVFTRRYFWPIVPDFGCYRAKHEKDAIPVTRKVGEQVLCLPIYNGLSLEQVDRIVDAIMACR